MNETIITELFTQDFLKMKVLPILIKDRTTGRNIVWATDTYAPYGASYQQERQMLPDSVINLIRKGDLLPRIQKTKEQQQIRMKEKAEVFTPLWICNSMNNHLDNEWFGQTGVFNTEHEDHTWEATEEKVPFPEQASKRIAPWQRYVDSRRLKITCGEGTFLASRYNTTTGKHLEILNRIGILDRKLRIVNENTKTEEEC